NLIDPSIFISLRQNDWRDNHQTKMIIWSLESPHHPDFGKNYPKGRSKRMNASSQVMSFLILGSVIGFILYTYLAHVITTRRLNRELKAAHLRELVHRTNPKSPMFPVHNFTHGPNRRERYYHGLPYRTYRSFSKRMLMDARFSSEYSQMPEPNPWDLDQLLQGEQ
ncbi:hypothetical protein TELCIR_13887, partial [Teladorsagia circumcincta]